jgi:translation elongation factor EF-Tu-like GTPase
MYMGWTFVRRGGPEQLDAEALIAKARAEAASKASPVSRRAPIGALDFRMVVEDVFYIAGRGVVVTGRISAGEVRVDDPIAIMRRGRRRRTTVVEVIEQYRERLDRAKVGDNVGLQLAEIARREIASGDILTTPQ